MSLRALPLEVTQLASGGGGVAVVGAGDVGDVLLFMNESRCPSLQGSRSLMSAGYTSVDVVVAVVVVVMAAFSALVFR